MAIRNWSPGKVLLIWGVEIVLLVILGSLAETRDDLPRLLFLWLILALPAIYITWKWFEGRERKPPGAPPRKAGPRDVQD